MQNYNNDRDFKYVIRDTSSTQIGSRYTYEEMMFCDNVPLKFQSIIHLYILKYASPELEIGEHILQMKDEDYTYQIFRQLRVKIRFCEPKPSGGYKLKNLKFDEFKKYQQVNWTENHVIQEVTLSNLALMAFTV